MSYAARLGNVVRCTSRGSAKTSAASALCRLPVEDPHEVVLHRPDERIGLVAPTPGEALLRPATRGRARLDVARPDLVRQEAVLGGQRDGIPTSTEEEHRER